MAFRRKYYRRRRTTRRRRPLYVRAAVKRMAAKVTVKRGIKRTIEGYFEAKSRQLINYGRDLYSVPSGPFAASNILPLNFSNGSMNIQQGSGNGQRVGNRFRVKKFMFKGTLTPNNYDATVNPTPKPMQVRMWFFYQRDAPTTIPTPMTDFFDSNNTSVGMNGDLTDLWTPVNSDKYRLLGIRQFKLGSSTYGQGAAIVGSINSNNDFKLNCNFSVNVAKMLPKVVRYIDNNVDASSRGCFVMIEPVWADGTVAPNTTLMCRMDYMLDCQYVDA